MTESDTTTPDVSESPSMFSAENPNRNKVIGGIVAGSLVFLIVLYLLWPSSEPVSSVRKKKTTKKTPTTTRTPTSTPRSVVASTVVRSSTAPVFTPTTSPLATRAVGADGNILDYTLGARIMGSPSAAQAEHPQWFGPSSSQGYHGLSSSSMASWTASGILHNTTNSADLTQRVEKYRNNAVTWTNPGNSSKTSPFYIVIDIGSNQEFNTAVWFQTDSDGSFANARLKYYPLGQAPTGFDDTRWVQAHDWVVGPTSRTGHVQTSFPTVRTRYVMVEAAGSNFGQSYIEIYGLKLAKV